MALTYSKDRTAVPSGNLTITATFTEPIVTTPTIAIVAPGGANSQAATFMSPTGSSSVWTFTRNITSRRGADGEATVIVSNALNAVGEGSRPPTNETFSVLSSDPPVARIAAVQFRAGPRAISLDGTGRTLVYLWRQLSGPSGVIANANQAVTTFQAPELESNSGARQYYFELTVDLSPPGDRSEPFVVLVQQGVTPAVPAAATAGGTFVPGGGCSLPLSTGPAGGVGGGLLLLPLAAWLLVRRRRRLTL